MILFKSLNEAKWVSRELSGVGRRMNVAVMPAGGEVRFVLISLYSHVKNDLIINKQEQYRLTPEGIKDVRAQEDGNSSAYGERDPRVDKRGEEVSVSHQRREQRHVKAGVGSRWNETWRED